MDRGGRTSTQDGGAESIGVVVEAVAAALTAMRPLRRECDRLLNLYMAGTADAGDLHRYQMTRLRLVMMESANRGVGRPRGAVAVLARRSRLDFHAMVDHTGQFPEPQPS